MTRHMQEAQMRLIAPTPHDRVSFYPKAHSRQGPFAAQRRIVVGTTVEIGAKRRFSGVRSHKLERDRGRYHCSQTAAGGFPRRVRSISCAMSR